MNIQKHLQAATILCFTFLSLWFIPGVALSASGKRVQFPFRNQPSRFVPKVLENFHVHNGRHLFADGAISRFGKGFKSTGHFRVINENGASGVTESQFSMIPLLVPKSVSPGSRINIVSVELVDSSGGLLQVGYSYKPTKKNLNLLPERKIVYDVSGSQRQTHSVSGVLNRKKIRPDGEEVEFQREFKLEKKKGEAGESELFIQLSPGDIEPQIQVRVPGDGVMGSLDDVVDMNLVDIRYEPYTGGFDFEIQLLRSNGMIYTYLLPLHPDTTPDQLIHTGQRNRFQFEPPFRPNWDFPDATIHREPFAIEGGGFDPSAGADGAISGS